MRSEVWKCTTLRLNARQPPHSPPPGTLFIVMIMPHWHCLWALADVWRAPWVAPVFPHKTGLYQWPQKASPWRETPPPFRKKDNEKKPLPASIRTDLNGFFCVKGQVPRATACTGEGAGVCICIDSGVSTCHKFSRGLFGTRVFLTENPSPLLEDGQNSAANPHWWPDGTPFLQTANALSPAEDAHRPSALLRFGS